MGNAEKVEKTPSTSQPSHHGSLPLTVIESEETGVRLNLNELWRYRELLYFLTLRDIKVRYKQTLLGSVWVVVQPLFIMLIVTVVFGRFVRLEETEMPYPLFAYSGLLLWVFFSNAVINSTNSLTSNTNLITKVYFPRIFIPVAAVVAGLVDLGIASLVLVFIGFYYGASFSSNLLLLPVFVALVTLLALATGLLVSASTVKYRDLRHALPFVLQFWMFASPVIYPASLVPEGWYWLIFLNPLSAILQGFRSALANGAIDWPALAVSLTLTAVLLMCAIYVFRRTEDTFADLI